MLPIKEHAWPKNASLNEYRVADVTSAHKILTKREDPLPANRAPEEQADEKETLLLKIQYADAEVAALLAMAEGEKCLKSIFLAAGCALSAKQALRLSRKKLSHEKRDVERFNVNV